jgi:hypothetical protein
MKMISSSSLIILILFATVHSHADLLSTTEIPKDPSECKLYLKNCGKVSVFSKAKCLTIQAAGCNVIWTAQNSGSCRRLGYCGYKGKTLCLNSIKKGAKCIYSARTGKCVTDRDIDKVPTEFPTEQPTYSPTVHPTLVDIPPRGDQYEWYELGEEYEYGYEYSYEYSYEYNNNHTVENTTTTTLLN